jgi:hypothetical protein
MSVRMAANYAFSKLNEDIINSFDPIKKNIYNNLVDYIHYKYPRFETWGRIGRRTPSNGNNINVNVIINNTNATIVMPYDFCGGDMNERYIFNSMLKSENSTIIGYNTLNDIHSIVTFSLEKDDSDPYNTDRYYIYIDALCVNNPSRHSGAGYLMKVIIDLCENNPNIDFINLSAINVANTISFYTYYGFINKSDPRRSIVEKQRETPNAPINDNEIDTILANMFGQPEQQNAQPPTDESIPTDADWQITIEILKTMPPDNIKFNNGSYRYIKMPKKYEDYYTGNEYKEIMKQSSRSRRRPVSTRTAPIHIFSTKAAQNRQLEKMAINRRKQASIRNNLRRGVPTETIGGRKKRRKTKKKMYKKYKQSKKYRKH